MNPRILVVKSFCKVNTLSTSGRNPRINPTRKNLKCPRAVLETRSLFQPQWKLVENFLINPKAVSSLSKLSFGSCAHAYNHHHLLPKPQVHRLLQPERLLRQSPGPAIAAGPLAAGLREDRPGGDMGRERRRRRLLRVVGAVLLHQHRYG